MVKKLFILPVDTCSAIFVAILLKKLGNEQKFLHISQLMAYNKIVVYNRILVTCKENHISSFSDKWMILGTFILTELTQTPKNKHCMSFHLWILTTNLQMQEHVPAEIRKVKRDHGRGEKVLQRGG